MARRRGGEIHMHNKNFGKSHGMKNRSVFFSVFSFLCEVFALAFIHCCILFTIQFRSGFFIIFFSSSSYADLWPNTNKMKRKKTFIREKLFHINFFTWKLSIRFGKVHWSECVSIEFDSIFHCQMSASNRDCRAKFPLLFLFIFCSM